MNNLKIKIDQANFLLRSTAGHALVLLAMIAVQLFATTTFFSLLMHKGKAWIFQAGIPNEISYLTGFLFALSLEFGIYFAAINGHKQMSNWFAFISAVLAIISFKSLAFQDGVFVNTIETWLNVIGILVISIYPAVFIANVSHRLYDIYEQEGWKIPEPVPEPKHKAKAQGNTVEVLETDEISEAIKNLKSDLKLS